MIPYIVVFILNFLFASLAEKCYARQHFMYLCSMLFIVVLDTIFIGLRDFLRKTLGPVLRAHLETVDKDAVQAALDVSGQRTKRTADARHVLVEVVVDRTRRKLVRLKPDSMV